MVYSFVIEPIAYTAFADEMEQIDKCKEWGLLSEKAAKSKTFLYKGYGRNEPCEIVGYVDDMTAVLEFADGRRHCIHPAYLKEMQAANFGRRSAAAADSEEGADASSAEEAAQAETVPSAAEAVSEAPAETDALVEIEVFEEDGALVQKERPAQAEAQVTPAEPKPAKRSKSSKVQLPEEKVRLVATVKEFTTVPNHFSDNDDEVVIYEAVSILDSETELGDAWSSHSATVKKWELNVGDTITFEAKVIAKKLTKHPVPYKINNPAKMQKEGS
ncbi:hypothetical protein [Cohnella zeiphila]|uniref:Uncharacterized protein n=1 Tax=Cohnella zeiphila TaxID=2761120 RepID=A0A7X0VXY9_9BACL|nr:hypothetical protein [Cohnella zeiphila]MBB6734814.1 hypothetical protein [Cohnella zeiphila]